MTVAAKFEIEYMQYLGPDGKVVKRWDGVKVDGHAEEVLAAVETL